MCNANVIRAYAQRRSVHIERLQAVVQVPKKSLAAINGRRRTPYGVTGFFPVLSSLCAYLNCNFSASAFNRISRKSCQERKSFRSTLFQKGRRAWGRAPQTHSVRSAKGEFQNSPVDYFERGNALQERAFPSCSASLSFRVPLWNAIQYKKFITIKAHKRFSTLKMRRKPNESVAVNSSAGLRDSANITKIKTTRKILSHNFLPQLLEARDSEVRSKMSILKSLRKT